MENIWYMVEHVAKYNTENNLNKIETWLSEKLNNMTSFDQNPICEHVKKTENLLQKEYVIDNVSDILL